MIMKEKFWKSFDILICADPIDGMDAYEQEHPAKELQKAPASMSTRIIDYCCQKIEELDAR